MPGSGDYRLKLPAEAREGVRRLCAELRELIEADDPTVTRLFPDAHRDDPEESARFDELVRDGLVGGRLAALDTVERTLDADQLTHDELEAWCGVLNDLRLVIGERLGVTEDLYEEGIDPRDPRAPQLALYGWLTWLQGEMVEVLAARL